ncbi:MAG TPA: S9 family peptidase [Candidatus Acidoferrales bacterium]|nr:S9 family peptidase [Candidatus Acidoferrales bacterium]
MATKITPYGSWKSPIGADLVASAGVGLQQIRIDGEDIYWIESRPQESGRKVVVRRTPDGNHEDTTPAPFNARTRVHEYGGGDYVVHDGTVYFSNFADQRIYRIRRGENPLPFTPTGPFRYADAVIAPRQNLLICVREDHSTSGEPVNSVVAINLDASAVRSLVSGSDFYSSPRLNPDGTKLLWLCWNHPNMPWDGTELWVADLDVNGSLSGAVKIAGSEKESIFQPEWSPDGKIYFVSDRTGWWNLYRRTNGKVDPLCPLEAEFGKPQWIFSQSTYAFESPHRIVCTYVQQGDTRLALLDIDTGNLDAIKLPFTAIPEVHSSVDQILLIAGSSAEPLSVANYSLTTRKCKILRRSSSITVDPGFLSRPEEIQFTTAGNQIAHGFYYPPKNRDFVGPADEKPPLIVMSHGGPTSSTSTSLRLSIQYWTSRGIAVLDVDYRGSSGYGRAYRDALKGQWGIADVDDCANGALFLVAQGKADGKRLAITGGSAGGYTTLCALTFRDTFKAGASHYGISDLEALAKDTHKFESRYLDSLIGPFPEQRSLYVERSPIHFTDRLSCPMILLQGLEDKVVPPNQAEKMVQAVRAKGLPVAYLTFEGEQHGFRKAENIKRVLEAELYFYSKVFQFELADPVEPVKIENL